MKKTTFLIFFLAASLSVFSQPPVRHTAIIGAMNEEIEIFETHITEKKTTYYQGLKFVSGKIAGRPVVVAKTGIGKVNAAMTTTLLIERFNPKEVVFTGIAGSLNPSLQPGDIVVASRVSQHDFGTYAEEGMVSWGTWNPINDKRNPVFFNAEPKLLELAEKAGASVSLRPIMSALGERMPKIVRGTVVTGDVFVASEEKTLEIKRRMSNPDAVEMEGAAVAQICFQQQIPCIIIRSISDSANENARFDYQEFIKVAAYNSASLVLEMIGKLPSP